MASRPDVHVDAGARRCRQRDHGERTRGGRGPRGRRHGQVHVRQHGRARRRSAELAAAQGDQEQRRARSTSTGDEVDGPVSGSRTIETLVEDVAHDAPPLDRPGPRRLRGHGDAPRRATPATWSARERVLRRRARDRSAGGNSVRISVPGTAGQSCTFTNRFRHAGAISVSKDDARRRRHDALPDPPDRRTRDRVRAVRDDDRAGRASGGRGRPHRRRSRSASTRSRRPRPRSSATTASGASCASTATAPPSTAREAASSCA